MQRPKWYTWLLLALILGPAVTPLSVAIFDEMVPQARATESLSIMRLVLWLIPVQAAGCLWLSCGHPFIIAGDETYARKKTMPAAAKNLISRVLFPLFISVSTTIIAGVFLVIAYLERDSEATRFIGFVVGVAMLADIAFLVTALILIPRLHRIIVGNAARWRLCLKCGYDLRGTAEGRACPECGAAITAKPGG